MLKYFIPFLLVASCSTPAQNAILPDELTLGHGRGTSQMGGTVTPWWENEEWPVDMEGESESMYVALTWDLPSINDEPKSTERGDVRASSVILDLAEEEAENTPIGAGATFQADGRHAAIFAGVIGLLIIFLLIKLRRSNGWH